MIETTLADVTRTVTELVAEQPDYVYSSPEHQRSALTCFYVHTDEDGDNAAPGCLVGAALHKLGVPLDVLSGYEGKDAYRAASNLLTLPSDEQRNSALQFLSAAQSYQDGGLPWGESLRMATVHLETVAV